MSQHRYHKTEIFVRRTLNQNIEATFDFMRHNRGNWLRGMSLLVFLYAVVLALAWSGQIGSTGFSAPTDFFEELIDRPVLLLFLLPDVFACMLFTASLVLESNAGTISGVLSPRRSLAICRGRVLATAVAVIVLSVVLYAVSVAPAPLNVLLVIIVVPLWLYHPASLMSDSLLSSLPKAFVPGFARWFSSFVQILFFCLVGYMLALSGSVLCSILTNIGSLFGINGYQSDNLFVSVLTFVSTAVQLLSCLTALSLITVGSIYMYGSAMANNELLARQIDDFENL